MTDLDDLADKIKELIAMQLEALLDLGCHFKAIKGVDPLEVRHVALSVFLTEDEAEELIVFANQEELSNEDRKRALEIGLQQAERSAAYEEPTEEAG